MKVEMICTGEEVLSGQIIDTNAAWFADALINKGYELQRKTTVGDRMEDLVSLFKERSRHADVILVNGGLGPTSDDLSAEAAAKALDESLVEDTGWRTHLEGWFEKRNRKMPPSNLKQCLLPESAILVDNPIGSAPGFRIKLNKAWLFFTPGVPVELKRMVEEQFLPFLQEIATDPQPVKVQKLLTLGHGESSLAENLKTLAVPDGITLGYRPSVPHVEIKLICRGQKAIDILPIFTEQVRQVLGTAIVTERFPSISQEAHTLLVDSGNTLSLAESCTGGMLSSQLVEFPGSSNYLKQSLVTYSNEAKHQLLHVKNETLRNFGAVSPQTAHEMATGARQLLDTDFALSVTGIAGPDGGSDEKPVGLVYIGLADREHCWVQGIHLSIRTRTLVRTMSCAVALDMLRRRFLNEPVVVDYPFISRVFSELQHSK